MLIVPSVPFKWYNYALVNMVTAKELSERWNSNICFLFPAWVQPTHQYTFKASVTSHTLTRLVNKLLRGQGLRDFQIATKAKSTLPLGGSSNPCKWKIMEPIDCVLFISVGFPLFWPESEWKINTACTFRYKLLKSDRNYWNLLMYMDSICISLQTDRGFRSPIPRTGKQNPEQ